MSASVASRRVLALPLACAAVVLGLVACGGGEDEGETTRSTPPAPAQTENGEARKSGEEGSAQGKGVRREEEVDLSVRPTSVKSARVTETGSVQTLPPSEQARRTAQKNSYGSIRSFGAETEGEEATNITFALVQYLDARARGDWATACARIYTVLRESFEAEGKSCAETFGRLMSRVPASSLGEQARIDVSSVRRGEGNRAFVIYKTPSTLSADMPMYVEDGVWKVGAIEAYALTPDQVG